jgi:hypothetical protein
MVLRYGRTLLLQNQSLGPAVPSYRDAVPPALWEVLKTNLLQASSSIARIPTVMWTAPILLSAKLGHIYEHSLTNFVEEWKHNVASTLKPSTVRAAESHLRTHILPTMGKMPLTGINTRNVQAFISALTAKG